MEIHGQHDRARLLAAAPENLGSATAGSRRWFALALVAAAFFMGVLDSTSVYTALPTIALELSFSPGAIQWVITAYGITVAGLLLLGGRLADRLGRRRVFLTAVGVFAAASVLCGLAWSSDVLVAARVVQGAGAAILTPAGLSILMTIFAEGRDRNRALGVWGGLGGMGATAGLMLGGPITDGLGWSWIFWVNVPVCVGVLALGPVLLPESRARGRSFDVAGAVAITAALVLIVYALSTVPGRGWWAFHTAGPAVAALVLLAVFVAIEARSGAPLVPLRLFRSKVLVGGNLVMLIAGMSVDGLLIILTLYAQRVLGYSAIQFGMAMVVMTLVSVGAVIVGQHLVTRLGLRLVASGGMTLIGLACLLLTQVPLDGRFVGDLLVGLLIFGVGMGAAFVASQIAALTGVADHESGLASGIEETSFAIGTTLGVALASAVAVAHADRLIDAGAATAVAETEGFRFAFGVLAGVTVLGVIAALTLLGRSQSTRGEQAGYPKAMS
ncbi:MFS transporter [Haloechinothrix sp. LS1_15]|uniref:MFS transporter n=1 Tax=Haloechinothrix sp. LS1_15 TaxID=2652248 RepID=UPI00294414C9|nr:MFS transporter [Haloechinothrix sp. LS1_15]MDV6011762.1 MFS transporter [Haloechinothrix sp. LS1_15]